MLHRLQYPVLPFYHAEKRTVTGDIDAIALKVEGNFLYQTNWA